MYFAVCSLIVRWDVTRGIFDLVREAIYACQAMVYGIVALASSGRKTV